MLKTSPGSRQQLSKLPLQPNILPRQPVFSMPALNRKGAQKLQANLPDHDVDAILSGSEDQGLNEEQIQLEEFLKATVTRPAGIETLRDWGAVLLPAGKHKAKSHSAAFEADLAYAALMARKTTLTSAWARSFQQYSIARLRAMARAEKEKKDKAKVNPPEMDKPKGIKTAGDRGMEAATKTARSNPEELDMEEWKLCPATDSKGLASTALCPAPSSRASASTKRTNTEQTSGAMKDDMSAEKKLELLTRQALLRRELAQLQQTLEDDPK